MSGAICQPGIIRFPRSFNEINNSGGEIWRKTRGKEKRIIPAATRGDTTEDPSRVCLIYSLSPLSLQRSDRNRETRRDVFYIRDVITGNTDHRLSSVLF